MGLVATAPAGYGAGGTARPAQPARAAVGGYGQQGTAYANYQEIQKKKSPIGWWIGGAALVVAIIVIAVIAIRARSAARSASPASPPAARPPQDACPPEKDGDGRPERASQRRPGARRPDLLPRRSAPRGAPPHGDNRVPFGSDVRNQVVPVETNYDGKGTDWVASVLVGELQAGDGFFTPEQGSEIVVQCILGKFYGNNPVQSDVKVNEATQVDGHEAWIVESQLSFDIEDLKTKGELLIVVIVSAGARSGLYYASIPDTTPELVQPARDLIPQLEVTE